MAELTSETFYNTASHAGFSRDFSFRVTDISVGGKSIDDPAGNENTSPEAIYARTASYPGRTIEDKIASFGGHEFHLGGRATYSNAAAFPIEFYVDEKLKLRDTFEEMSRETFDWGVGGKGFNFDVNSTITLRPLDKTGGNATTKAITLQGCSIRDVGDINYVIADGTGEVVVFTVTFAYQYYTNAQASTPAE